MYNDEEIRTIAIIIVHTNYRNFLFVFLFCFNLSSFIHLDIER